MSRKILFYVPEHDLAEAIGKLAARHGHLEYSLRMTVKSVEKSTIVEALRATQWWGAKQLRERILKGARARFGDGVEYENVARVLGRAAALSERRNRFVHGLYAQELDGRPIFRDQDTPWMPLPTSAEVGALAAEIGSFTDELNDARLQGWLKAAIEAAG